jgi:ribonuclease P protein component
VVARQYRLREEHDVRRVRSRGRAVAHGPLVIRYLRNTLDPSQNRYTVIAGKKCGKAVQRNRLKRLVREALRGYHPYLDTGYDIAVICRGTVEEMPDLETAQRTLATILKRTPLVSDPEHAPAPGTPITTSWTAPTPTMNEPETSSEPSGENDEDKEPTS